MDTTKRYRPNVAAVALNDKGEILACERSDVDGAWQLPQGGIEEGETPEEALRRELEEEIGVTEFELICALPDPIRYDWPPKHYRRGFHGQEQYYFLIRLPTGTTIDLAKASAHEFQRCQWMGEAEFRSRLRGFKAEAYQLALDRLKTIIPQCIAP